MSKQRLQQKQYQNLSPQQIQFLGLLQIPIVALEKRIEEELEDNPALEEEEEEKSLEERAYKQENSSTNDFSQFQIEDKTESLTDYLTAQLIATNATKEEKFLLIYLINSLDDNGFLNRDLHSISSDLLISNNLDISENKLDASLKILQQLEPYGVGAKNLQECLLIQLKIRYPDKALLQTIIKDHYRAFSNKNYEYLSKHLNVDTVTLKSAYSIIESLNPIPGSGFSKQSENTEFIYPDFTVTLRNNQLELLLNNSNVKHVNVSTTYKDMFINTTDADTKEFLKQKLDKAQWFRDAITRRFETLKNVMLAILKLQESYFKTGDDSNLKPMKLADVAQVVNMDISTISRVSNSKYVATDFGTFKLKELFSEAYRKDNGSLISTNEIKSKLQDIIKNEDKVRPYTDEQLSHILGENEYHIARRTVAKYREELKISTAKLRRVL